MSPEPLRVTLLTYGTRGDVEPFCALAERLTQAGVRIRLAAPEGFRYLATSPMVEYFGLPGDIRSLAGELADHAGANPPRMIAAITRHIRQIALEAMGTLEQACRGADCVVHSFLMTATGHLHATTFDIPEVSAQLFPVFCPTSEFPGPTFPDLPLGPVYRRMTHLLNAQIYWQGSRILYRGVRRLKPGLAPLPGYPFAKRAASRVPILYAFSPSVIPRPRDWPASSVITGYWFRDLPPDWRPPPELLRFLEAGDAPVFVGLGSMTGRKGRETVRRCASSLTEVGLRGVVALGETEREGAELDSNFCVVGDIPYAWLFPRVAAVIHHGGAGTTAAALRAGRPSLVLPVSADQGFWAHRLRKLGAAPPPLRRRTLGDDVRRGLRSIRDDPSIRRRAEELGSQIAVEDGVGRAADEILRLLPART